jgi:hypothetical protein
MPAGQPDPAALYWREFGQLKAASICIRLYRRTAGQRLLAVEVVKAVAAGGSIATWAVWRQLPLLWAAIIAAAQVADALKNVFPLARMHSAAAELTVALELLCADCENDLERVLSGRLAADGITRLRTQLRRRRLEAERRFFPHGVDFSRKDVELATEEATAYLEITYS